MVNQSEDPQQPRPEDEYLGDSQMMTYRQQTHREYHEPRLFREPKGGLPVPESWPADERFWQQLDTNLKALYMQREYELPPLDVETFPSVGERRGQWAKPDLVEADVSMPYEYIKVSDEGDAVKRERVIEYSLPDAEWDELTKEQQQRYMAL